MLTFCIETIHHAADELQLILQAEVDEVGVYEDTIWGHKGRVVLQEQRRGNLRSNGPPDVGAVRE